jgi:tRNA threonylcarbamoyladenosine biosynthesis protein TsaB
VTPLVLAIDTSSEFASLALARRREVFDEVLLHSTDGFAHLLYPQLQRLLENAGVRSGEIDCFAAAAGPGSFTGIRVALSAAKGLAESAAKKVVAVSNLEALAWYGEGALRSPVLDARRGEVFAAVYDAKGRAVIPETVCKFQDWLALLPKDQAIEFVVTDPGLFPIEGKPVTVAPRSFARAVAMIAAERFAAGLAQDPAAIDANYVRRSDAEMHWREAY